MEYTDIEEGAEALRKEVAKRQYHLWPGQQRTALQLLDPEGACRSLGLVYIEQDSLLKQPSHLETEKRRIAGQLNMQTRIVTVAAEFGDAVKRFTTMHEVGHFILHHDKMPIMHRDGPSDGSILTSIEKPVFEREAEYFAACYLMPQDLVIHEFRIRFGNTTPITIDDQVAFNLCPYDPESLLRASKGSLDRETALAKCTKFGESYFKSSLADTFGVSYKAMAIRIKELGLVRWP